MINKRIIFGIIIGFLSVSNYVLADEKTYNCIEYILKYKIIPDECNKVLDKKSMYFIQPDLESACLEYIVKYKVVPNECIKVLNKNLSHYPKPDFLELTCLGYLHNYKIMPDECKNILNKNSTKNNPNFNDFSNSNNKKKYGMETLKYNMHVFQTMLETFAVDYQATYPKNVKSLVKEAKECKNPYYKELRNPSYEKQPTLVDYNDYPNKNFPPLCVIYKVELSSELIATEDDLKFLNNDYKIGDKRVINYQIFGTDEKGNILKENGKEFFLSNP